MSIEEIRKRLEENSRLSSSGLFGETTIRDQYKNADGLLSDLDQMYQESQNEENEEDRMTEAEYNNFANMFKGQRANAVLSGVLTGVQGLSDIGANAMRSATINDTSYYDAQLDNAARAGNYNYGSYTQLNNDMMNQPNIAPLSYEDIRGMNNLQKAGSIFSSALSGASTGAQIGGLPGALIGLGAGVIGGGAGVLVGNANARAKESYYASKAAQANAISNANFNAAHERIADTENRYKMARVVAHGGQIERKRESIQDFASRVLRAPSNQVRTRPADMVRTYEDGGVRIKIRRK